MKFNWRFYRIKFYRFAQSDPREKNRIPQREKKQIPVNFIGSWDLLLPPLIRSVAEFYQKMSVLMLIFSDKVVCLKMADQLHHGVRQFEHVTHSLTSEINVNIDYPQFFFNSSILCHWSNAKHTSLSSSCFCRYSLYQFEVFFHIVMTSLHHISLHLHLVFPWKSEREVAAINGSLSNKKILQKKRKIGFLRWWILLSS